MPEVQPEMMTQINAHLETIAKSQASMSKSQAELAKEQGSMNGRLLKLEIKLEADKEMRHERNNAISESLAKHDERLSNQSAKISGVQRLVYIGVGAATVVSLFAQNIWSKMTGGPPA